MAIEAYIVAWDIKDAGPGYQLAFAEKLGAKEEASIGHTEFETAGNSLSKDGVKGAATCKLVEVLASSAEEAVEVVHQKYGDYSGKARTVVKPNTNFKAVDK